VEVKIGVQYAMREIVFESNDNADDVAKAVADAVKSGGLLNLTDEHGRRIVVPADKLAYVEIGEPVERRVGFGTI
jgi:hypothetical protein